MTSSWTYIAESVPWILAGLLVGYFMGRSTVAAEVIAEAAQDDGGTMTDTPKRQRFTATTVLGVVIVVLGVFTAVQSYVQSEETARLAACQTAYSDGFADALDARSKASAEAQDALDELLSTVASITPTPKARTDFREALTEYLDKRAEAKQTQKDNPYPPAPRDVCKETE